MFFRLVTSVGQRKTSESPCGNEPQTFAFRAPMLCHWTTETPQWVRSITKFIFFPCPTFVTRRKKIFLYFFTELNLSYHLSYFYIMKTLFLKDTNPYRKTNYALNVSIVRKFFCVYKASLVWHKGLDDIRRFVCQSKYFVSSYHRKKTCYTVIPTVMLVWTWAELSKVRRRVILGLIGNVSFFCSCN